MCSGSVEAAEITGSGKGPRGWFSLRQAQAVRDHPFHAYMDESLMIDFLDPSEGPGARLSVELSPDSAERLVGIINAALRSGGHGK